MIKESEGFTVKEFVNQLCELGVQTSSKQIAEFLTKKGYPVTWQVVAGIKGSFNKKNA
jgi:hypothetical protein